MKKGKMVAAIRPLGQSEGDERWETKSHSPTLSKTI